MAVRRFIAASVRRLGSWIAGSALPKDLRQFGVDVAVIGSGVAGLSAGLSSARQGHSTLVFCPEGPGGALLSIEGIEDFPGFPDGIAGFELCPDLQRQAEENGAKFLPEEVIGLRRDGADWVVMTTTGPIEARTVIITTGTRARSLRVPGEEQLIGRGISHCASCDGPLWANLPVAVIGGGDAAAQEALTLARYASSVLIFHDQKELSAQSTYRQRVLDHHLITVHELSEVIEMIGTSSLEGIRVRLEDQQESEIPVRGVVVHVGREPQTDFLGSLVERAEDGRISVDSFMSTDLPGLFAAGDVRAGSAGQAGTAAGDGMMAGLSAHRYIEGRDGVAGGAS